VSDLPDGIGGSRRGPPRRRAELRRLGVPRAKNHLRDRAHAD